ERAFRPPAADQQERRAARAQRRRIRAQAVLLRHRAGRAPDGARLAYEAGAVVPDPVWHRLSVPDGHRPRQRTDRVRVQRERSRRDRPGERAGAAAALEGARINQGSRVIDADSLGNPSSDRLRRYGSEALHAELAPYLRTVKVQAGRGDSEDQAESTILSYRQLRYQRVAGAKA